MQPPPVSTNLHPPKNPPTVSSKYVNKENKAVLAAIILFQESLQHTAFLQTYADNLCVSVERIKEQLCVRTIEVKTMSVSAYNNDMVDGRRRWADEDDMMAGWVDVVPHGQENKLFLNAMVRSSFLISFSSSTTQ